MKRYECRILSETGQVVDDIFEAENEVSLKSIFLQRGCKLISLKEKKESVLNFQIGKVKLKQKTVVLFCRQMSTLLKAGVPLVKCFDILLAQNSDKTLESTLKTLSMDVQSGSLLSVSMNKMDGRFPQMLIKMIEIGEVTGNLDQMLERMANKYEKDDKIKKKTKSALTYPIFLLTMALVACVFMLVKIVPSFVEQFEGMDAELPAITAIMIKISDSLKAYWYIYIASVVVIVIVFVRIFKIPIVKQKWHYFLFAKSPVKGPVSKIVCSGVARTLNILVSSGIPLVQSIEYTARNTDNEYVKDCLIKIAIGMQEGKGFSEQLEAFGTFPSLFVSMINIGEESGKLEEMLGKTSEYYDNETEAAIEQLMALMQPAMILIVGLLIGAIVIAMYSPMFALNTAV